MKDIVFLHGLKAESLIGVYAWERTRSQTLLFDIDLYTDCSAAGRSDEVEDALHYAEAAAFVRDLAAGRTFSLLEALAEYIAAELLKRFPCSGVRLRITKPGILPHVAATGVEIERRRAQ